MKERLVVVLTVGFVGASFGLAGCSSEEPGTGTGGAAGGGTAGSTAGVMSTGGAGAGMSGTGGTSGATSGGTAGATSGGTSGATGGSAGSSAGSGAAAGAGNGGGGAGGGMGGAGQGGASGGAGSGGMSGGAGGRGGAGAGGAGGGSGGSGSFTLTSPDHMNGAMFADPYTCAEAGFDGSIIPELRWSGAPAGTMSFAITFIDRTLAPANMNGYHWVIWNIPASTMMLPEGFKDQMSIGAQENRDFLGPCPNFSGTGTVTDDYEFTIYALSQASITVTPATGTMAVRNAEMTLEAMNLAKAKLTGRSNARPGP